MTQKVADRVKETTTVTGTGNATLLGAASGGYQTFASAYSTSSLVGYCIADATNNAWEVGIGTFTAGPDTLARTTVTASSNAGAAVSFAAGTKEVFSTYLASLMYAMPFAGVKPQTATTYTVLTGDKAKLIVHNSATAVAVTQPIVSVANFPGASDPGGAWFCWHQNIGAGTVTITPTTSSIDNGTNIVLTTGQGCLIASEGSSGTSSYFTMRGVPTGANPAGFTGALNVASPNNGVNNSSLTASGGTSAQSISYIWKGTNGFFSVSTPDGSTTGGNLRGPGAFDTQGPSARAAATAVASGTRSGNLGTNNATCSGAQSASVASTSASSTGDQSFTQGTSTTADSVNGVAMGSNATTRGLDGSIAHSSGGSSPGQVQRQWGCGRRNSVFSSTPVTCTADGSAPAVNNIPTMANNSRMGFTVRIIMMDSTDTFDQEIKGTLVRGANAAATSILGTNVATSLGKSAGATTKIWSSAVVADTTSGGLAAQITDGSAGGTVNGRSYFETFHAA